MVAICEAKCRTRTRLSSFVNLSPERDEEPSRSERSFAMTRPTEANSVEADLREARCAVKEMQEEEESEGMNEPSM